jgi:ABC-type nickel/cobalt efflux system permease component RcnA
MLDVASILIVATAFVLGLGHSLDPDHIIAVSTLLCNSTSLRKSVVSATFWGVGHSTVLLVVGLLVLGLRIIIPESVVQLLELAAATMLIVLGILVFRPVLTHWLHPEKQARSEDTHAFEHATEHNHPHRHDHDHSHLHKSALTGIVQGLAGSAAIMLVTLATVNSLELGIVFILVFGGGVILGMVGIACLINSLLNYTASRLKGMHEKIVAVTGIISISFGIFIFAQTLLNLHV